MVKPNTPEFRFDRARVIFITVLCRPHFRLDNGRTIEFSLALKRFNKCFTRKEK